MNGVETFLSKVGRGFKTVFEWLGSAQGQTVVAGAETAATLAATAVGGPALGAAVTGIESLVNAGLKSAINIETLSAAAAQQAGTGAQKGAAVAVSLSSNVGTFLKSIGLTDATSEEVQNLASVIGKASADILNAIPARAITPAA